MRRTFDFVTPGGGPTPDDINRTVRDFLNGAPAPRRLPAARPRHRRAAPSLGLVRAARSERARVASVTSGLPFPAYYPRLTPGAGSQQDARRYPIRDEQGHVHHAYRVVFSTGLIGSYYGVQGMDWTNPPLLTTPSTKLTVGGRAFELFYDGPRLRWVAWRTPRAVYWISNSLLETLSQKQMLAIAESAAPLA